MSFLKASGFENQSEATKVLLCPWWTTEQVGSKDEGVLTGAPYLGHDIYIHITPNKIIYLIFLGESPTSESARASISAEDRILSNMTDSYLCPI